jgi:ABC-type Fe3+/spermidine/putrescine transport system ATPase subunit
MPEPEACELEIRQVVKRFGRVVAVDDVSLSVPKGEIIALLGPSGSGKTTLLSMIGGQIPPDAGDILIDGASVKGLPPNKIDTATVFQDYALFPHLNVAENIGFGLHMRHMPRAEIAERVMDMLKLVGLSNLGHRKVSQLSGGQRQRIATARALIVEPRVLLMDEPLGALDQQIRKRLQDELSDLLRKLKVTTVIVTHDQEEAFAMTDRVAVMESGRLEQVDSPESLYRNPATPFVATFIGSGVLLDGRAVGRRKEKTLVEVAGAQILCRGEGSDGWAVKVVVRPEDVKLNRPGEGDQVTWPEATVIRAVESGEVTRYTIDVGGAVVRCLALGLRKHVSGEQVTVTLKPDGPVIVLTNPNSGLQE